MAAEIYNTFGEKVSEVSLKPGPTGSFEVKYGDEVLSSMLASGEHVEFTRLREMIAERLET